MFNMLVVIVAAYPSLSERWGVRSGLCHSDIPTAVKLIDDMDNNLSQRILWNENHTLCKGVDCPTILHAVYTML